MFVIEGLKRRGREPREEENPRFKKYQNRYEKLYLSGENDLENWKKYKSYLQDMVKKDQGESYNPRGTFGADPRTITFEGSPLRVSRMRRNRTSLRTEGDLGVIQE